MRQIFRIDKNQHCISLQKRISRCEGYVKQTIEDIRKLLSDNAFKDEQHVRFCLVGRVCQKLGWDIWNPKEFYTEYPVKRYPPQEVTVDLRGRIDVALILPEKNSDIAEVFIEIKTPYKLQSELVSGEIQLKRYNWWDKSAISVLTDGIIWRFYLPSIGGAFENSLFSEIDLLHDDIESICTVFEQVLRRNNFRKQAVESAETIYEEIARIKKLSSVKTEAGDIAKKTGLSKYTLASQILKNQYNYDMDVPEIERLWDKKIPKVTQAPTSENQPDNPINEGATNDPLPPDKADYSVMQDYRYKSARVVVIRGTKIQVRYWWEIKKHVFNFLIDKQNSPVFLKNLHLTNQMNDSMDIKLNNGMYTRGRMSASDIVKQCREVMKTAGYDPVKDLLVGYVESQRKKKAVNKI